MMTIEQQKIIRLKGNETQKLLVVCSGSEKRELTIELAGVGAAVQVYGLFFGTDSDIIELSVAVTHAVPHTTSEILLIGALAGRAEASVKGSIVIAPGAEKSDGREEIKTLLLSPEARIRTIPELKILNNDVKCSHAVATTHIDEEKKFYLESRGMNEAEAVQAVIAGHFALLLDRAADEGLRTDIVKKINSLF